MHFPIGSHVRIADYTGDDQIDYYIGQTLETVGYREIPVIAYYTRFHKPVYDPSIPNYDLLAPDGIVITANEYELEAA